MSISKFTEAKLEEAIIQLLEDQGYPYTRGTDLERAPGDVLIRSDLREFLASRYAADHFNAKTPSREDAKKKLGIGIFASLRLREFALIPFWKPAHE